MKDKGEILINGEKTEYFKNLINLDENIVDLKFMIIKLY